MAVRYPPRNNVPPVNPQRRSSRVTKYQEPPVGFGRRWLRRLFHPALVIPVIVLLAVGVFALGYFYMQFSERIDARLRGDIFTRAAGIYAAPKELRVGAAMNAETLIGRLKNSGYVEKSQRADESRGRYAVQENNVEIEPSGEMTIDGAQPYPRVRVQFARGGKTIAALIDLGSQRRLETALIEPELITSVSSGSDREKRRIVGYRDLPPHLVKAITVTEDRSFFQHHGINLRGIVRAFVRRYDADPNSPIARQGGSSITQQLVKNLLLTPERTWRRKFAEAYMSLILETRLSKEEIFALYCNEAYLGQRAGFSINGFGEAAGSYFNKDVTALTLPESALLAGLIRSPNRYNPHRHFDTALARRNQVLDSMAQAGEVSAAEATAAKAAELKVAPVRGRIDTAEAPYFADFVQGQLGDFIADEGAAQHLRIYTTVDMDLQRAAYAAVNKQLNALDKMYAKRVAPGTLQAALVAMNAETGEVVAMVGGRDYEKSQLNRATDAMRQPGSVFKPFVYATALNTAYEPIPRVITPATMYVDAPKTFSYDAQQYSPGNFGDAYSNKLITLRDALVKSLNVVTVEVAMEVTIGRVMNLASKAGLPRPAKTYPSMALGASEATPLQIASAYTAFASKGVRATPVAINRITNGKGQTVIAPTAQKNQVLTPEVAFVMTSFMKDVVNRGTAARLRARGFKANVAGKTGTSRDGWFAGYTPKLVCAVYVGFDDGSQLGLTGADSALPIWADFMSAALAAHPEWGGDWQMPPGVQEAEIDLSTGALASAAAAPVAPPAVTGETEDVMMEPVAIRPVVKRKEYFINNTVPTEPASTVNEENAPELPETEAQDGLADETLPPAFPNDTPSDDNYSPAPRAPVVPRLEGRGVRQPDGSTRLMGTVTLDIDPTTGLIAAASCPVIRSKSFQIGQQPTQYCGPDHHTGNISPPPAAATRPRLAMP